MQVWNVLHTARWNTGRKNDQKFAICAPSYNFVGMGYIVATKARIDNREKNLSSNISSRCVHNMVNFGLLEAEIDPVVWGTTSHLYSAGRPSRWASAHILDVYRLFSKTWSRCREIPVCDA